MKLLSLSTRVTAAATAGVIGALGMTGLASLTGPLHSHGQRAVRVEVASPSRGDDAGIAGAAWVVDLQLDYRGPGALAKAGFSTPQLTGPAGHTNIPPFPGTFSTGKDDRLPGLVVLTSTTDATLPGFSGPGTNLANLFNLTGVTERSERSAQIWDTWVVGAPIAGRDVDTVLTVAVIDDLDHRSTTTHRRSWSTPTTTGTSTPGT